MDPNKPSRLVQVPSYPKDVFLESSLLFLACNYLYHQNVFRRTSNKLAFSAFLAVNAFTSFTLVDAINPRAIGYYAALYNNS